MAEQILDQSIKLGSGVFGRPVIYSGTFYPLHDGHISVVRKLQDMGYQPVLEIPIAPLGKPDRCRNDFVTIAGQLYDAGVRSASIIYTTYTFFYEKATLMVRPRFAVGADTLIRILESDHNTIAPFSTFLVAPRINAFGLTDTLFSVLDSHAREAAELARERAVEFEVIPIEPTNISSTGIREREERERGGKD